MVYYIIQAFKKKIDEKYKKHLYPSFICSYNIEISGKGFGIQGNINDALKCVDKKDILPFINKAIDIFGDIYEFEVIIIDRRFFGRDKHKFVYNPESFKNK